VGHGLPLALYQRVRSSQLQYLALRPGIFAGRIQSGRVCEGHGDLRPEHVCLEDPPVVFDCVEFSLAFRAADVASELAFLAMECEFLEAPELGAALIAGYNGKVELLRAGQQAEAAATRSRRRARRYLQLASFYASEFHRPKLLVMVGAAGTGKSTIASALAEAVGAELVRTDAVRHELAGRRQADAAYRQGIYADSVTDETYRELFRRAASLLASGIATVLDGTFRDIRQRDEARQIAKRYGVDVHFLYCRCPSQVARARIADRIARREGISDARPTLHDIQQQELDSATDLEPPTTIYLDTCQPVPLLIQQILHSLAPAPAAPVHE
jgi:predicted kinase